MIVTHDDGGPAFPCDVFDPDVEGPEQHEGMTLRDYFAAKAMQSLLMIMDQETYKKQVPLVPAAAYAIADAMLKARQS